MLLMCMGWGKLVPKKSRKKPGVGTSPALVGLTTLQARHNPSPPLFDWDSLLQSLAPAMVVAFEIFLTPCAA